jgi:hypothetical protein
MSSPRWRNAGMSKRKNVQPVVDDLRAAFLVATASAMSRLEVAMMRMSSGTGFLAADPFDLAFLEDAQQFRLQAERHFGDLRRAATCSVLRLLELAGLRLLRTGERALFVSRRALLRAGCPGMAAQLMATKGPLLRRARTG